MVMIRRTAAAFTAVTILGGCAVHEENLTSSHAASGAAAPEMHQSELAGDNENLRGAGAAGGHMADRRMAHRHMAHRHMSNARVGDANGNPDPRNGADARTPVPASAQLARADDADEDAARREGVPELGTTRFEPRDLPAFDPTDTFVGQKVAELRGDLAKLQDDIANHNDRLQSLRRQARGSAVGYHDLLAGITARLQIGTTPGNPELVQQWTQAQIELHRVEQTAAEMSELANDASSTSALAAFLLESVAASYGLSGGIERDHEHLALLEDTTNRTVVLIDRLLNELSEDVARQNTYLSRERRNLSTLSLAIQNGEFYGDSLANRAYGEPQAAPAEGPAAHVGNSRPLVVIRFDSETTPFQQPLYEAVAQALDRRPEAAFDVVAVAPQGADRAKSSLDREKARRQAGRVLRSLNDMGLPPNRVSLAATTSEDIETNEVHIYLR